MSRNLKLLSKCSVEAKKNTMLCKLHKVSMGFKPIGSNADPSLMLLPLRQ